MSLMTITQVCNSFDVSPRMLRYYEKEGLIASIHRDDYAYRMYDTASLLRIQQILALRKLGICLKDIHLILTDDNKQNVIRIFAETIKAQNDKIAAQTLTRNILEKLVRRLELSEESQHSLHLITDAQIVKVVQTLSLSQSKLEEVPSMERLEEANKVLRKDLRVRMVLLPPCTVASYHYIGENPEETVGEVMNQFIQESGLYEKKPDARMFGFNHPNPSQDNEPYGYEVWVTIPDDLELPDNLTKKSFSGGLYAALTIDFPNFGEWQDLTDWVDNNEIYEANYDELGPEIMCGCLEEHLNWVYSSHLGWPENGIDGQIDLLLPVRRK